jgi:hypothetical protein
MKRWVLLAAALPALGEVRVQLHVMHLQPAEGKVSVREIFLLEADKAGPGSLRFFVPRAGQATLRVSSQRPQEKPADVIPQRVSRDGVYLVNLPAAPGQTRVDITYAAPLSAEGTFAGKTFHPGVPLRLVTPSGFALEGEGVESLGQEGQASVYGVQGADFEVRVVEAEAGAEGPQIQQILPRTYEHLPWILAPTLLVLLAGFVRNWLRGAAAGGERRR